METKWSESPKENIKEVLPNVNRITREGGTYLENCVNPIKWFSDSYTRIFLSSFESIDNKHMYMTIQLAAKNNMETACELYTFFRIPPSMIYTTNMIERLFKELKRRLKGMEVLQGEEVLKR